MFDTLMYLYLVALVVGLTVGPTLDEAWGNRANAKRVALKAATRHAFRLARKLHKLSVKAGN
jgi:hypothetical protein